MYNKLCSMKSKASRLVTLYGLSIALLSTLGWAAGSHDTVLRYGLLWCVGAAALVCSFLMKKDTADAFTAAVAVVAAGLLLGLWFAVQGVVGLVAGTSGILMETLFFTCIAAFSLVLLPVLVRAWKLYRRFFRLLE